MWGNFGAAPEIKNEHKQYFQGYKLPKQYWQKGNELISHFIKALQEKKKEADSKVGLSMRKKDADKMYEIFDKNKISNFSMGSFDYDVDTLETRYVPIFPDLYKFFDKSTQIL